ncbi:MAG: N-acetyl-gamma-glutamyl-phosphate reductase [Mycobacteriales bacterium]
MGVTAAVVGASGYAGGELLRLLQAHPDFEVGPLVAGAAAGRRVGELHPQLPELAERRFSALADPQTLAADVVFLALPHGQSQEICESLPQTTLVVDLAADHRLVDPAQWERFYGGRYAPAWTYGLPELPGRRAQLALARRIAGPGCYATAVILALAPLLAAAVIEPRDVVVVAASGSSGAGRGLHDHLLGAAVMGDVSAYKVGGTHQHIPEIAQVLGLPTLSFTPLLAPMPRGILATATAPLSAGVDTAGLRAVLQSAYAGEAFVRVLADNDWPHTAATVGSNAAQLQVVADLDAGRAVVVSALDNLGKGAAGQAVQVANIALGLPETAGLTNAGVAP